MRKGEIDVSVFIAEQKKKRKIPMPHDKVSYLTVKKYAVLLDISTDTVYENLHKGRIEGAFQIGRQWRIPVKQTIPV